MVRGQRTLSCHKLRLFHEPQCWLCGGRGVLQYGQTIPLRGGELLVTLDGGHQWRLDNKAPASVQSACFTSRSDGWIGSPGKIWRTTDGDFAGRSPSPNRDVRGLLLNRATPRWCSVAGRVVPGSCFPAPVPPPGIPLMLPLPQRTGSSGVLCSRKDSPSPRSCP